MRHQLGLGRLLPLGGSRDGAWITEGAAGPVLRGAAAPVRGVRLGRLRIGPADPEASEEPVVPPPPSGLAPGPLRIEADFQAWAGPGTPAAEPLPATAARLRAALAAAAERIGLTVTEVDLRVTGLLDVGVEESGDTRGTTRATATDASASGGAAASGTDHPVDLREPGDDEESRVVAAALAVPGVTRLTGALGGAGRAVHLESGPALPRRHVRVEIAVSGRERALDVAVAVRSAVGGALTDHPSVAVVVTAVDPPPAPGSG
jgi:hypothetical protein